MEKDTIEAAHRVIARIEQRREAHKADERAKNRRASAMLTAAAKLPAPKLIGIDMAAEHNQAGRWKVSIGDIRTSEQRDAEREAQQGGITPGAIEWRIGFQRQAPRICICCGAPADRVQHD